MPRLERKAVKAKRAKIANRMSNVDPRDRMPLPTMSRRVAEQDGRITLDRIKIGYLRTTHERQVVRISELIDQNGVRQRDPNALIDAWVRLDDFVLLGVAECEGCDSEEDSEDEEPKPHRLTCRTRHSFTKEAYIAT